MKLAMNSWLAVWFGCLILGGCRGSEQFPTAKTTGRVLLDGQPLRTGKVIFIPEQGRSATGEIGPDGTFTLSTYAERDGAIVGRHRIAVMSVASPAGADPEDEDVPVTWRIPQRYGNASTSGLSYEVTADGPNDVPLDLSSK